MSNALLMIARPNVSWSGQCGREQMDLSLTWLLIGLFVWGLFSGLAFAETATTIELKMPEAAVTLAEPTSHLLIDNVADSFPSGLPNNLPNNLPGLVWQTNLDDPIFADPQAKKGGQLREMLIDFPVTFRRVGPNANSAFRGYLDVNQLALTDTHPQTQNPIPALARYWAIGADRKSVYYRLNSKARWSDGVPVSSADFVFALEFMRSKHIVAPWYNNYYTEEVVDVVAYDDLTLSVHLGAEKPLEDLLYFANLSPVPAHFHKKQLKAGWVQWANWQIEPVSGAYQIDRFRKGSYIEFRRVDNWWGETERYYQYRFNVDRVRFKVVRNLNIAWNMFLKGEFDTFPAVLPEYWHERATGKRFRLGQIDKYWIYTQTPQPSLGLYLNLDDPLFADQRVRHAIAYALNIDKMNQNLLRGDYDRLPNMDTGYGEYTNPNVQARPFDLNKANQLLDEAGWQRRNAAGIRQKGEVVLRFKVSYSSEEHNPRLALLKAEAAKAGIGLELQLLKGAASYRNIMEKKHQAAWTGWGAGYRPDYWQHFYSSNAHISQNNNITNTDDPKMDALIDAYQVASEKSARIDLAWQIQAYVAEIGAVIPTYMVPYERFVAWHYVRFPEALPENRRSRFPKHASELTNAMGLGVLWIAPDLKTAVQRGKTFVPTLVKDETYRQAPSSVVPTPVSQP